MNEDLGGPHALPAFTGCPVGQIGILVRDLEAAVRRSSALLRNGPWRIYTYSSAILTEQVYRGRPSQFAVRIALNSQDPQVEFLQPLQGPSIYHEWLDTHGEGLHHLAFWGESLDASMASLVEWSSDVTQYGKGMGTAGDGGFAYYDTVSVLGVVLETVERPTDRREAELVLP